MNRLCLSPLTLAALLMPIPALAQTATPVPRAQRAPELRMGGDVVTLPIVMVDEYPFVEAEVAGVRGKLMLDTGAEQALAINDHKVPVADAQVTGRGNFGSGQQFVTRMAPRIRELRIADLRFPAVTNVQTQDASQLEAITPDFIGWLGHYFWDGYALKLDYAHSRARFYRKGPAAYLAGERVVATIPFATRRLPNHPLVPARVGDIAVVAAFDTGQYGTLYTDAATRDRLVTQGVLKPVAGEADVFDLTGLTLAGRKLPGVPRITVDTGTFAAAAPIGIDEPAILTMGYGFLRQYKTVWDYRAKRLYLLARR